MSVLGNVLSGTGDDRRQFLTFFLGGEEYGIDILKVQEIKGWEPVRQLPDCPEYVCGVINLRGAMIPVIDLRLRFKLPEVLYESTTVVIIARLHDGDEERVIGWVVDAVSDVYTLDNEQLKPPPKVTGIIRSEFLEGVTSQDDRLIFLLDIDRLIAREVLESVAAEIS